jgi:hypothetical protein
VSSLNAAALFHVLTIYFNFIWPRVEEKLERKREKVDTVNEHLNKLQLESVKLVHEKEAEVEKNLQLQDEIQFLRDSRVGDVHASDSERLRQLELIQSLRARELELQNELEDQQKKWAVDRSTINQQIRLLEKEKNLALEKLKCCEEDAGAVQKKHGTLTELGPSVYKVSILTGVFGDGVRRPLVRGQRWCEGSAQRSAQPERLS